MLDSDHSIGRCFLYGAFAVPVGVTCHSTVAINSSSHTMLVPRDGASVSLAASAGEQNSKALVEIAAPGDLKLGMCFMLPHCDVNEQITCHRHKPEPIDASIRPSASTRDHLTRYKPVRTHSDRGYYRVYSSMFDGVKSDTYW